MHIPKSVELELNELELPISIQEEAGLTDDQLEILLTFAEATN